MPTRAPAKSPAKEAASTPVESKNTKTRKRSRYEPWQREMVKKEYPTCQTPEEKLELCRKAGIKDIRRLYNLACQEGITRRSDDLSDAEFRAYTNGDKNVMSLRQSYTPEEEKELLSFRQDPRETKFSREDDKFLIANYGRMSTPAIAKQRGFSETAVMYRARYLKRPGRTPEGEPTPPEPLRQPSVGFALDRVAAWLGLSEKELHGLTSVGVVIRPLPTRKGEVTGHWVLSQSLAPFLVKHGARLVKERNADLFFIKEILETEQLIKDDKVARAACFFVDHGHKCNNPWAGPRYETFCPNGVDSKCKVKELRF